MKKETKEKVEKKAISGMASIIRAVMRVIVPSKPGEI